ncbi:MAG: type I polyketide synthase, partial [Waterburya sp.]
GDPIEVNSLKTVLGEEREQDCYLGSLKTNIGHLEAAAGIAGLIKSVLCLQHQTIPPNLHFTQLNPLIDLSESKITIPQQLQPWDSSITRYAGVSSFGFGGTNAHVILGELWNPVREDGETGRGGDAESNKLLERPLHLLTLSAKSEQALTDLVLSYKDYLQANPEIALVDICHTANTGRIHFNQRLAITLDAYANAIAADSPAQLQEKLASFTAGKLKTGMAYGEVTHNNQIAFLFTGQGSQYVNMGYQLYQTQPVFRQALDQCAAILDNYLDQPLLAILYPAQSSSLQESLLNETVYTQPAIFALEYALAQMWLDWGIKPTALIGHSVGEYVAATIAGVFSLADGLKLLATRGKLMQSLSQAGEMYAVFASETKVKSVIEAFKEKVAIAAINSPQSIVISGEKTAVQAVISKFDAQGINSKQLTVSHAFHSPLMQPILEEFSQVAKSINYHQPQIKLISNVTGQVATTAISTPEYWVNHVIAPVRFADGMKTLQQECNIFLEIGSKPILLGMGRSTLATDNNQVQTAWLPSLRPRKEDWQQILQTLGFLYTSGLAINWQNFERGYNRQKVALPTYPFQRQSYWLEPNVKANNSKVKVYLPSSEQLKLQQPEFYQIEWQVYSGELNTKITPENNKPWLVFVDQQGLSKQIANQLEQAEGNYILVDNYELEANDLNQIFQQNQELQGVIYLTGLDNLSEPNITTINNYQQQHCTNILNLVQALYANSIATPIWLVT